MCFVSQLNFLSGVAAAVRRGCSIVEANKGPQRSLAFSQELWPEGEGGPRKTQTRSFVWYGSTRELFL